jgi:hypothetical protein
MRTLTFLLSLLLASSITRAQDKYYSSQYNKLIEVQGTEYVIASYSEWGKLYSITGRHLLFMNTLTGEINRIEFPIQTDIKKIEQVKIDSLDLNVILVSASTMDLDGKNGIDWKDPVQLMIMSPDGKEKIQVADDRFDIQLWTVNKQTGNLVVIGHYDNNYNGRVDKEEKNEILIYDLRNKLLIRKI